MSSKPKGVPTPPDLSEAVKALLGSMPETVACARLGLSPTAVARLAAGLTVRNGTIAQARAGLAQPIVNPAQLALIAV